MFAVYQEYKLLKSAEQRREFEQKVLDSAKSAKEEARKIHAEIKKDPVVLSNAVDDMLDK